MSYAHDSFMAFGDKVVQCAKLGSKNVDMIVKGDELILLSCNLGKSYVDIQNDMTYIFSGDATSIREAPNTDYPFLKLFDVLMYDGYGTKDLKCYALSNLTLYKDVNSFEGMFYWPNGNTTNVTEYVVLQIFMCYLMGFEYPPINMGDFLIESTSNKATWFTTYRNQRYKVRFGGNHDISFEYVY